MRNRFALGGALLLALAGLGMGTGHADTTCHPPVQPSVPARTPPGPATLAADRSSIEMTQGDSATIHARMHRPPDPTPVDVFFVVDTTWSMNPAICAVQKDVVAIAGHLAAAKFDVNFGVAAYKDYPIDPYGTKGLFAYKLVRNIGPLDRSLLRAIYNMNADRENDGDQGESGLTALFQAATGRGQHVDQSPFVEHPTPLTTSSKVYSDPDIAPGQQARWRPKALKLIVTISDSYLRDRTYEEPKYPGPLYSQTVRALRAQGILVAGIELNDGDRSDWGARIARDTGAIGPPGGIDCDGDGRVQPMPEGNDIGPGQGLVCNSDVDDSGSSADDTNGINLGPAIVQFVKALRDQSTVSYSVTGDTDVLASYAPHSAGNVDLKRDAFGALSLNVRCASDLPSGTRHLTISASVHGTIFASTVLTVVCDPKPPVVFNIVRAVAAPPPAPQPAPQLNGAPNPHAAGAAAMAPQEQAQLAYETVEGNAPREMRMMEASSRGRRNTAGAAAAIFGGACMAAAALGVKHKLNLAEERK